MKIRLKLFKIPGLLLLFSLSPFCSSTLMIDKDKTLTEPIQTSVIKNQGSIWQTGVASWYGHEFHGRRTANGEIYDMQRLTAAHQTLPFNSIVEVENLSNNRRVIVRINDRGPFVKNRIIDLSNKAAIILGMDEAGTTSVALRLFHKAGITGKEAKINLFLPKKTEVWYYIQVGAFSDGENGRRMLNKIRDLFPQIQWHIFFKDSFYKVISSKFSLKKEAVMLQQELNSHQIESFIKEL